MPQAGIVMLPLVMLSDGDYGNSAGKSLLKNLNFYFQW